MINFRPIENNDSFASGDDLPIYSLFFSVSGSTYRRIFAPSSNHFRICITASVLEHLHEVNFVIVVFISSLKIKF
jgi:hypothetical protein